jgi:hypothetical protein
MFEPFWRKLVVAGSVMVLALSVAVWSPISGQESKSPGKAKATRKEPRGRLPAHYKDVVSPDQREKIYEIQDKYAEQIEEALARLEQVRQAQAEEIEAVLTAEQKQKVAELKAASGNKRNKKGDTQKSGETAKTTAN